MSAEIYIQNGDAIYAPAVHEGITWSTERSGTPGKVSFSVETDDILDIVEGNAVGIKWNDGKVFYGFVFSKQEDRTNTIKITAYDQLRYFKNKETYTYTNKRADQLLRLIAKDFKLNVGTLDNTEYNIESRVEDNSTLFDMMSNALDLTLTNRRKLFILFDDFGALMLRNIANMKVDVLLDADTGENLTYKSSIDSKTYNKIKLAYDNEDAGTHDIYIAQDSANMNEWGVLQLTEDIKKGENGASKADALLELYNHKTRNLKIKGAFGDVRVRAGTLVPVRLKLNDIEIQNYMLVEKAKHTFKKNQHTMDLSLSGGGFSV